MKSVLITGAGGFIGRSLAAFLEPKKICVSATVHKSPCELPGVLIVSECDVVQAACWNDKIFETDVIVHLASLAHCLGKATSQLSQEFDKVNAYGTAELVKKAIAHGVKHFIFVSSIGAMATLSENALSETSICSPDTPYGKSKLKAEEAVKQLCKESSMTWTILRPSLVYGPRNPGNMYRLLKLIKKGLPLPLGGIENCRSLLYVGNLVEAIALCIDHPNARNQIFLISDGEDLSTPSLIRKIAQKMGRSPFLISIPPSVLTRSAQLLGKQETVNRLIGSLSINSQKIKDELNWKPSYTVDQGLQDTVDWFLQTSISQ